MSTCVDSLSYNDIGTLLHRSTCSGYRANLHEDLDLDTFCRESMYRVDYGLLQMCLCRISSK